MKVCIITGSCGLIGSEAVKYFSSKFDKIIGIDNNHRELFFGTSASTRPMKKHLIDTIKNYTQEDIDIRDQLLVDIIFSSYKSDIKLIIHTAAQPSHDYASRIPVTDFQINANGTLNLLESARQNCPEAVFIYTSTNKVYGDWPNSLQFDELPTRYDLPTSHELWNGLNESTPIDQCMHSLFGVSKLSGDLLVQEYGRYFGMPTGVFRGGCLTGPNHAGAPLHGFLSYLMKCAISGQEYTVNGYKSKQVRDNIHSYDLIKAFDCFYETPNRASVYNIGGGRHSNCSMMEAMSLCEEITGKSMNRKYIDEPRKGDHIWWISDVLKFKQGYPNWNYTYNVKDILTEIHSSIKKL